MKNILVLNYEFPPLWWGQANANYFLFKEFSKNKTWAIKSFLYNKENIYK